MNQKSYLENEVLSNGMTVGEVVNQIHAEEKMYMLSRVPNNELWEEDDVAMFLDVEIETIRTITQRHKNELLNDYILVNDKDGTLKSSYTLKNEGILKSDKVFYKKRSILRIGMLLDNSALTIEIRSRLIDSFLK